MIEGKELIGKRVKHIKENDNSSMLITNVENGTVFFENNGRTTLQNVKEFYTEVDNVYNENLNTNINIKPTYIPNSYDSDNIDPNLFFNPNNKTFANLANQIKSINTNNIGYSNQNGGFVSQAEKPKTEIINSRPAQPGEYNENMLKNNKAPIINSTDDPWVANQFNSEGKIRKVDTDQFKKELDNAKNGVSIAQKEYVDNKSNITNTSPAFPKMKKSTKVTLNLKFEEMIPKPESIKNMNELFEESIIDILAKEITLDYINDPKKLENLIKDELTNIVYKKKTIRNTRSKTKSTTNTKNSTSK